MNKKLTKSFMLAFALSLVMVGSVYSGNGGKVIPSTVSGYGEFFTGGWEGGMKSDFSALTDGVFQPRSSVWNISTVWWNSAMNDTPNYLRVSFGQERCVKKIIMQSDNNDDLIIRFNSNGEEQEISVVPDRHWGLDSPITIDIDVKTDAFTIEADPNGQNDGLFAVSEFMVIGKKCKRRGTSRRP